MHSQTSIDNKLSLISRNSFIILLISLIIILWNTTFTNIGGVFGQESEADNYNSNGSIKSITSETKFCPPGYIMDKSGYCDSEPKVVVPGMPSSIPKENITKETELWPESNNAFLTCKQLMSLGKLEYKVFGNESHGFKIEYPEGSPPSEYEGGFVDFYLGGDTVLSIYPSDLIPNDSSELGDYLDGAIDYFESSGDFPDFKLISTQLGTKFLAGHPSYSLAGTYNQGLGLVNKTAVIRDDRIYSIQYYGNDVSEHLPIIEHMIGSFNIIDKPIYGGLANLQYPSYLRLVVTLAC